MDDGHLQEALLLIPDAKKTAYLEALKIGSDFLRRESNPLLFLRREAFDSWAAAERLVSYWENRKNAFGDKAFLPLAFASYMDEAKRALWGGVYLQLPNDSRGRTVVYRDNKKLAKLSLEARLQLVFYLDRISNNNPRSSEEGIVLVTIVDMISFDRNTKVCTRVENNSMPTRSHSLHVLCSGYDTQADMIALGVVRWYTKDSTHIHVCETPEARSRALSPFGLKQECLPEFLGGSARPIPWKTFARETKFAVGSREPLSMPLRPDTINIIGIDQIDRDLLVSTDLKDEAQKQLEEAIRSMPDAQTAVYQDALNRFPNLVHTESIPAWFLLYENFDAQAAARRLTSYWEERKKAFGDKAFLPLTTLTGEVPYDEETIRAFREDVVVILPKDSKGRFAIFLNQPKLYKLSCASRIQVLFYMFAMAMRNIESIRQGYVVVSVMDRIYFDPNSSIVMYIKSKVMPIPLHSAHIFCKSNTLKVGIVPLSLPILRFVANQKVHFHLCRSLEERACELIKFGFTKDGLPIVLGGHWDASQNRENAPAPVNNDSKTPNHNIPSIPASTGTSKGKGIQELISFEISTKDTESLSTWIEPKRSYSRMDSCTKERGESTSLRPSKRQCPSVTILDSDVLLGKGTKYAKHPGNLLLQSYIEKYKIRHEEAYQKYKETHAARDRRSLQQINQEIYDSICQAGRFLKCGQDDQTIPSDSWYEVSSSMALKKIAMSFRYNNNLKGAQQQTLASLEPIASVLHSDVLLGKGTKYLRHPGNLRLLQLIELHSDRYDEASAKHRNKNDNEACGDMHQIVRDVYTAICQTGRFLKFVENDNPHLPGNWYEVSGDIAIKKIGMSFRNHRKRKRSKR